MGRSIHNLEPAAQRPLIKVFRSTDETLLRPATALQGYLAHKRMPPPPEKPWGPRHSATVGSNEEAVSCERGTRVIPERWTCSLCISTAVQSAAHQDKSREWGRVKAKVEPL